MTEATEVSSSLILEGGGNRGVFTAGALDFLMEKDVKFPYVVGFPQAPAMPLTMFPISRGAPGTV